MTNWIQKLTTNERRFIEQSDIFLAETLRRYPNAASLTIGDLFRTEPAAPDPIEIEALNAVSSVAIARIESDFRSHRGVAHLDLLDHSVEPGLPHSILQLADVLATALPTSYPIDHPMELHPEAAHRFGVPDGTLKLYNLPVETDGPRYREQAETNEMFDAHNDGLGYAGAIRASMIMLDQPPRSGGFTYFQNLGFIAAVMAASDEDAYRSLFLPDVLTSLRPRGKGAIRVTGPVLYVNEIGQPQICYRRDCGEYRMTWRTDVEPLQRAAEILERLTRPFAPGSTFVHMTQPGQAVLLDNTQVIHGRTSFSVSGGFNRVLARKWFVARPEDQAYKHVPGLNVHPEYGVLFPELFGPELQRGDWNFDPELGINRLNETIGAEV